MQWSIAVLSFHLDYRPCSRISYESLRQRVGDSSEADLGFLWEKGYSWREKLPTPILPFFPKQNDHPLMQGPFRILPAVSGKVFIQLPGDSGCDLAEGFP